MVFVQGMFTYERKVKEMELESRMLIALGVATCATIVMISGMHFNLWERLSSGSRTDSSRTTKQVVSSGKIREKRQVLSNEETQ